MLRRHCRHQCATYVSILKFNLMEVVIYCVTSRPMESHVPEVPAMNFPYSGSPRPKLVWGVGVGGEGPILADSMIDR